MQYLHTKAGPQREDSGLSEAGLILQKATGNGYDVFSCVMVWTQVILLALNNNTVIKVTVGTM